MRWQQNVGETAESVGGAKEWDQQDDINVAFHAEGSVSEWTMFPLHTQLVGMLSKNPFDNL